MAFFGICCGLRIETRVSASFVQRPAPFITIQDSMVFMASPSIGTRNVQELLPRVVFSNRFQLVVGQWKPRLFRNFGSDHGVFFSWVSSTQKNDEYITENVASDHTSECTRAPSPTWVVGEFPFWGRENDTAAGGSPRLNCSNNCAAMPSGCKAQMHYVHGICWHPTCNRHQNFWQHSNRIRRTHIFFLCGMSVARMTPTQWWDDGVISKRNLHPMMCRVVFDCPRKRDRDTPCNRGIQRKCQKGHSQH